MNQGTITQILARHRQAGDVALADAIAAVYRDLQGIGSRRLALALADLCR